MCFATRRRAGIQRKANVIVIAIIDNCRQVSCNEAEYRTTANVSNTESIQTPLLQRVLGTIYLCHILGLRHPPRHPGVCVLSGRRVILQRCL